ncbi:MAG: hypothetical protein FJ096_15740 [Deltaproteobacteria bacterium]|nr:hypothetical protein [Deltaproteobacteria bacterium]
MLPIARGLRTRIPFASVADVMRYLTETPRVLVYGDDAEKFGLWPTTHAQVWGDRWLERFFEALEAGADTIETVLPGRLLADEPNAGLVYLPTLAYPELGEWALPTEATRAYRRLAGRLRETGLEAAAARFLRGGIWQGFLAKYPE